MPSAPPPADESERLASLARMKLLDTPAEDRFDRLTRLASRHFRAPYSMITLLDEQRQWFKSACGHRLTETPREIAFCGYTILQEEPLVVEDASVDERFFDNPVVRGEMGIRFYAGVPLRNGEQQRVGTLCVLDTQPRRLSWEELNSLRDLAACAETELQLLRLTVSEQELLQEMDALRRKASVDALTRCWNEETTLDLLGREYRRGTGGLAVMVLMIDGFAQLNETLGHERADDVLREVAERLRTSLDVTEILGRGPGAQFLVLVPSLGPARALPYAERLVHTVQRAPIQELPVRLSAGVAFYRGKHEKPAELLARARKAASRAQKQGGNRAEVAI